MKRVLFAGVIAMMLFLTGCTSEASGNSDADCLILDACSTVKISSDEEACDAITSIFAPLNDGSTPTLDKFKKAWPEIESLAFQAQDASLVEALNKTSINLHAFVLEMEKNGKTSPFIVNQLGTNFESLLSACEDVYR